MKKVFIIISFFLLAFQAMPQEFNCNISVSSSKLQGTDRRVFESMQKVLYDFINNRKWTNYNIKYEERLDCTILLTINDRLGSDEFRGSLNVVLRRPVINTAYNSPLLNINEKEFQFRFVEMQTMDFSENTFNSNFTSVIAFYIYIALGFEFDSFSPEGGKPYFEKAQTIVSAAQNATEPGWKGYEGTRNRYWLAENMMNPANNDLHDFLYKFHRLGLDQMYEKLEAGRGNITESLELLRKLYNAKPDLYALIIILDAKRDEFVNIYSDQKVPPLEKTSVTNLLKEIDPANSSKYQAILAK
ncbi:MAG: DUF4835 family protein [Bacteroidetes bacterium]|nr:DUF4835 family protein [Bacteroidota bacterium]